MKRPSFKLRSPETDTEYWIYASVPKRRGPWPVMLFMDGDDQFGPAVVAYQRLRKAGRVPVMLLIGVGYGASYTKPANRRGRDYTPVHHAFEPSSGGGDAYLRFLTNTLSPELCRRYPIDSSLRGLAGYSLGSLLVLHALFQRKPFFTHYLAGSPSIWWADRAILKQAVRLRTRQSVLPGKLFLGVGEKDSASMTGDLALLEQQLSEKPFRKLKVISRRFPGKNHFNALPAVFQAGLRTLLAH